MSTTTNIKKITNNVTIDISGNIENTGYVKSKHAVLNTQGSKPLAGASGFGVLWTSGNSLYFTDPTNTDHDITAGGGGAGTLSATLTLGNTTGANNIVLTNNAIITSSGAGQDLTIESGVVSGLLTLKTIDSSNYANATGQVELCSGNNTGDGSIYYISSHTGGVFVFSGDAPFGKSGGVDIYTGASGADDTGNINIYTGATNGISGTVTISTKRGVITTGSIQIKPADQYGSTVVANFTTADVTLEGFQSTSNIVLTPGSGTGKIQLGTVYWPKTAGTANQFLSTNGTDTAAWTSFSGDIISSGSTQKVIALQTYPVKNILPKDGYVLTWVDADGYWEPKPATGGTGTSFTAAGDLSGTSTSQTVIALQGRSVYNTTPSDGYFLGWTAASSRWEPKAAPSGSFSAGGDLSGSSSSQTVIKIQGKSVATTTPTDGYALVWNNSAAQWQPYSVLQLTGYDLADIYSNVIIEPSGFNTTTTSTVAITDGYRLFSIAPVSGSFDFYVKGKKFTKNTAQTINWANTEGINFIYFDANGALQTTTDLTVWQSVVNGNGACVWAINWDATNLLVRRTMEERHGTKMPGVVHWYNHSFLGTQWISGGSLANFVIGNGSLDTHAQFSSTNCVIADEDIQFSITDDSPQNISPILNAPVFYRNGASGLWLFKTANNFPFIASGEAGYTGASGRACYNQYTGVTWTRTEVAQGNFFLVHLLATTDVRTPIISILGQAEYATSNLAQAGATTEAGSIQGVLNLLSTEYKFLGTVIYQTASTYANTVKARVVLTADGSNYIDLRTSRITGSGATVNNHGALTGLSNDDHLQYVHITNARTITAQHTFAPASPLAPFVLGANAQSQLVTGLNADLLDGLHGSSYTFTASGDLSGTNATQRVIALQTYPVKNILPTNNQVLTWVDADGYWEPKTPASGFTAGGDLSGTSTSQTVIGLRGRTVSSAVPNDGYFLGWNNSLAQWESKAAPSGSFSAGGDLSGSSSSQTVIALQGKSVATTAPSDGYALVWSSTNNRWQPGYVSASPGSGGSAPLVLIAGTSNITDTSYNDVGAVYISSSYTAFTTITFQSIGYVSTGRTLSIRLYNLTDGTVVGSSTLTTTSTTPVIITTSLSAPSSAKIYILQAKLDINTGAEVGIIHNSILIFG